jgi:hypothetical protein
MRAAFGRDDISAGFRCPADSSDRTFATLNAVSSDKYNDFAEADKRKWCIALERRVWTGKLRMLL